MSPDEVSTAAERSCRDRSGRSRRRCRPDRRYRDRALPVAGMRRLEEDAAVAQDIGGQMIARRVGQPDGVAAADQRRLQLEARGRPAGIHDAFPGGIKRRDGIFAESGDARCGDPPARGISQICHESPARCFPAKSTRRPSNEIAGSADAANPGARVWFGPARTDLNRRAARETIGASSFVMRCLGEKERRRRRRTRLPRPAITTPRITGI